MTYQIDWTRFSFILMISIFMSSLFFYLAFRVLKRNFNKTTLALGLFYIFPGTAFILNILFVPLSTTVIGFIIYFLIAYFLIFGITFLIIFIISLLYVNFSLKKQFLIITFYAISIFLLLYLPHGINIVDGIPVFALQFSIIIYLYLSILILLPYIFLSKRLLKLFEDKALKRKLRYFILGCLGMILSLYGTILHNTWQYPLFRLIWNFISLIIIPFGFFIYYGIGQNL